MPHQSVVVLLKRVQLPVVSAPIGHNLTRFILDRNAFHGPLTIDEAAVAHLQCRIGLLVALIAHRADKCDQLPINRGHCVAAIYHYQLVAGSTLRVPTVAEPAQPVLDLAVPRRLILPIDLPHRLDRVEREVNTYGQQAGGLRSRSSLRLHHDGFLFYL